jgi:hypothetical protein
MKKIGLIIIVNFLLFSCNPFKQINKPYTDRLRKFEKEQKQIQTSARKCATYSGTLKNNRLRLYTDAFHHYRYNKQQKECPAVEKKKK